MLSRLPAKGTEIKRLRTEAGYTLRQLSRLAGLSPAFIAHVELYGKIPSPEFIIGLALPLKVQPEKLLQVARETQLQRIDHDHAAALDRWRQGSPETARDD